MKSLFSSLAIVCLAMLLMPSCNKEDPKPSLGFLPCAQIIFQDSLIERDLNMGISVLKASVPFTVNSPVGLKSVKLRLVNRNSETRVVDTILVKEFTSFDDAYHYSTSYDLTLSGTSISVNVLAEDTRNQTSDRSVTVRMNNGKLPPKFEWTKTLGGATDNKGVSMVVRKYDTDNNANYNTTLYARLVSYNGGVAPNYNMSFGMDKVDVYATYSNGDEVRIDEPSKNFSDPAAASCVGCRYRYEFAFKPEWERADGSTITKIRIEAEDLRYQKTKANIEVKVYKDYAAPEIFFMEPEMAVDPNSAETSPILHYVRSYDVGLRRLVYYVVKADGSVDSVGYNTNISPSVDGITRYASTLVSNVNLKKYASDVVAFRVRAVNRQNKESYKDISLVPATDIEGVTQILKQVIYTKKQQSADIQKPYIFSLATRQAYMDGEGATCESPDFLFNCSTAANIYLESPTSANSGWTGAKTRRTRYLKVAASAFDNATQASLEALRSEVTAKGELSVSSKNRTPAALVGIFKDISVDGATIMGATAEVNMVNLPPDLWLLVKLDNTDGWKYDRVVERSAAAVNVAYAFVNNDGVVGIIKIEEAFAWFPTNGAIGTNQQMDRQRITFSIRYIAPQ